VWPLMGLRVSLVVFACSALSALVFEVAVDSGQHSMHASTCSLRRSINTAEISDTVMLT
jgi:hypothetical protein